MMTNIQNLGSILEILNKSLFHFLSFPINNNRNYVLKIEYGVTTGRILHTYVRFKDETHLSWEGVEWKEIDIQYK